MTKYEGLQYYLRTNLILTHIGFELVTHPTRPLDGLSVAQLLKQFVFYETLSQMNPVHTLPPDSFKNQLNIILSRGVLLSSLFPSGFLSQIYCGIFAQRRNCGARETAVARERL
jgi:hypothetical protein